MESNLIMHAKRELISLGYDYQGDEDEMSTMMANNLIELLNVFSDQGHSGFSASYCVSMFQKLAMLKPLSPLKGDPEEWEKVSEDIWQNKRCGRVFKGKDGKAYDSEGKVFKEPNGTCYTSRESRVYIDFPYSPKTEYIEVDS